MAELETITIDPEISLLSNNKLSGYNYRQRRHAEWRENYTLYRDKAQVNRLIQRQSVHIPLMKTMVRSMLKDVDDMPVLRFENLDNDKAAEIFKNAYWDHTVEINNMELQDIVDKKQVFLFGRSFDQWQIINGKVKMTVQDPEDILVSRYMDPFDLHSSRFLIHTHIFVPLASLELNKDYDQRKISELKKWFATDQGLIKSASNAQMLAEKNQKMSDLGVNDVDAPVLGETYVELSLHFVFRKEDGDEEEQIYLYVEAEDKKILMKKRLEEVIGLTSDHYWRKHYPYNSWADDLERQDFWSDAIGDIVRTPNKVLDAYFSQIIENGTLRNLSMHYYDSTASEEFHPNTFTPQAWGWYGVPGKPTDVVQRVDIPELTNALKEMEYVQTITEKATGSTAPQQGAPVQKQITLGEVQLNLTEAKERIKGMSKFYTPAWKQRGMLFVKLLEAAGDKIDAVRLYKKGRNTNDLYGREVSPSDWMSKSGYRCKVWSQEDKNTQDTQKLQKLAYARTLMPNNPKLDNILKRKSVEYADCSPEEINEIMEFEETSMRGMMPAIMPGMENKPMQNQSMQQNRLMPNSQVNPMQT